MIDEELLHPDIKIAIRFLSKDMKRLKALAKKIGKPYKVSLLIRLFVREGLDKREKEFKGKRK